MECDYLCVFCHRSDINLYEMNENSVLIEGILVDFKNIVLDLFFASVRIVYISVFYF